jgi:hypothetical protein
VNLDESSSVQTLHAREWFLTKHCGLLHFPKDIGTCYCFEKFYQHPEFISMLILRGRVVISVAKVGTQNLPKKV